MVTVQTNNRDREFKRQLKAADILEKLEPKHPNHPGIPHYIIHSYDYPELAVRGADGKPLALKDTLNAGKPFPNNQIPMDRINPQLQAFLMQYVPMPNMSIACSIRRDTASAGAGTGWMSPGLGRARASSGTKFATTPGVIATTSSAPSTTTSRTAGS